MTPEQAKALADRLLREAGFRDIESPCGMVSDKPVDGSRAEYYRAAEEELSRRKWRSERHREIWWRHCQGTPARAIARALRLNRKTVDAVITEVRAAMQARVMRRGGRPSNPLGYGSHARGHYVRLSEREEDAAGRLCQRWGAAFPQVVRRLLLAVDQMGDSWAIPDIRLRRK